MGVDRNRLVAASEMVGEEPEETLELQTMLTEAVSYMQSFSWCPPIKATYFGGGIAGVVAVFLFEFSRPVRGTDSELWVVVGDVPPAYFVVDQAPTPAEALGVYCDLMHSWTEAARGKKDAGEVFPVNAPLDTEHARLLEKRIAFLKKKVVPELGIG